MTTATVQDIPALIDAFLTQVQAEYQRDRLAFHFNFDPTKTDTGRAILELPREQQIQVVFDVVTRQVARIKNRHSCASAELTAMLGAILRRKLPFSPGDLEALVRTTAEIDHAGWWSAVSPLGIVRAVEDQVAAQGMPVTLRDGLELLAAKLRKHDDYADARTLLQRVDNLLKRSSQLASTADGAVDPSAVTFLRPATVELNSDEVWTRSLRAALDAMAAGPRQHWDALLALCDSANASKPSKKWLQQAQALVEAIGVETFARTTGATLAEVGKPGVPRKAPPNALGFIADPTQVHETNADLLRGLVWCTSLLDDERLIVSVGDTAEVCFKKLPGIGPRAPKIGNACLWALGQRSTTAAVGQLSRLQARAKHASIRTQLSKAFDVAAEKTGLSTADLAEVAVPTCGLTGVGECRKTLGNFTALLNITDELDVEVAWRSATGKSQKSVPGALNETCPDDVKALKGMAKELTKLLPGQRDRLERLFLQERSWTVPEFRARFLDHPLVGTLARRLIWRFTEGARTGAGIWHEGHIVDAAGRPLDWLGTATRVVLWHPLNSSVVQVKAWRDWLHAHEVRQPFKQAHREIYLLTDAERQTGVYSNRFAAHILKQHQFSALCQQRGWRYSLQGAWDSHNTPSIVLPQWDIRAEFWVEPIRDAAPQPARQDLSHHMIFVFLATDQVRFYRAESPIPLPLVEVPPLVLSEVLRDVDLFVGVASIGNAPTWNDGGLLGGHRDYWLTFAFGALLPSAQTRKEVLENVVPRLKIADRCSFSDRFLIVRGDLRTYKIHLGSSNILMAPNDQYLCIVPRQSEAAPLGVKLFLPFAGDPLLSIIVSKAMLLAEDSKIADRTIRNQIEAGL